MGRSETVTLSVRRLSTVATLIWLLILTSADLHAQYTGQWLDVGSWHAVYSELGTRPEAELGVPEGAEYPAILRHSGHVRRRALWIGTKDWTDEHGQQLPYYVARIGPQWADSAISFPLQNRLIGRYEDTQVTVDGFSSFDSAKVSILDATDPSLPADRMVHNIHNMRPGITVDRRAYAWTNPFFDNFHIITYEYCNSGNLDADEAIELPGQTLKDVYFFRIHGWRGGKQAARAHPWGRYNIIDIVGDGHEDYPVDFTAIYLWYGREDDFWGYDNLGSPLWEDEHRMIAPGDSVGRLAGLSFVGRVVLHAESSPTDSTYVRCTRETADTCQPHTLGFINNDDVLIYSDGTSEDYTHEDYYELGILTRENPDRFPGGHSRMYPHYADRVEPSGEFWNSSFGADMGSQGGWSPNTAYGPYTLAFNECVDIAVAEGAAGLSYDASVQVGRIFKASGGDSGLPIAYDANGDGIIDETPFDYSTLYVGTERQTKNQWVMSERDSLFKMFERAKAIWETSDGLARYPIPEPPRAPVQFSIDSRADGIGLSWIPANSGPAVDHWELYRTSQFEDNLLDADGDGLHELDAEGNIRTGYEHVAVIPTDETTYDDTTAQSGRDYFYYLVGIGQPQPNDPSGVAGTPAGVPLQSGRYLTQTYLPASLLPQTATDTRVPGKHYYISGSYPNPFRLTTTTRLVVAESEHLRIDVVDLRGRSVRVLHEGLVTAHTPLFLTFDGSGLPSGTYFLRVKGETFDAVRKVTKLR